MQKNTRNELLVQRFADTVSDGGNYIENQLEIAREMRAWTSLTYEDVKGINDFIKLIKQMGDEQLLDTGHQPDRLLILGAQCADLKRRIIRRMGGDRNAFPREIPIQAEATA